jgi:hypothetical protein
MYNPIERGGLLRGLYKLGEKKFGQLVLHEESAFTRYSICIVF